MRILYLIRSLGIKGGVGKTTISLYLARYFSRSKCLFIDLDTLSYGSLILGHKKMGLIDEILNKKPIFSESLQIFNNIHTLKMYSDPFIISKINDEIISIANQKLVELVKTNKWEFVIIDNPPSINPNKITSLLNAENVVDIFITDPISVEATVNYFNVVKSPLAINVLLLNLVPPIEKDIEEAKKVLESYRSLFDILVLEIFEERLYLYRPSREINFESRILNRLADAILNKQKTIILP